MIEKENFMTNVNVPTFPVLQDKVVIVTEAASGLGKAAAILFCGSKRQSRGGGFQL